jgi:hypothetical protein
MYVNPEIERELKKNQRLSVIVLEALDDPESQHMIPALKAELEVLQKQGNRLRDLQMAGWIKATEERG